MIRIFSCRLCACVELDWKSSVNQPENPCIFKHSKAQAIHYNLYHVPTLYTEMHNNISVTYIAIGSYCVLKFGKLKQVAGKLLYIPLKMGTSCAAACVLRVCYFLLSLWSNDISIYCLLHRTTKCKLQESQMTDATLQNHCPIWSSVQTYKQYHFA